MVLKISTIPPVFSKSELLLRTFFGSLYIVVPHVIMILIHLPIIVFHYVRNITSLLVDGKPHYPSEIVLVNFINWLGNLHRSVYNLVDGYPVIGLKNQISLLKVQQDVNHQLLWILLSPFVVICIVLYVIMVTPFIGLATVVAFFMVLITNNYPERIYLLQIMHLNVVLRLLSKILLGK